MSASSSLQKTQPISSPAKLTGRAEKRRRAIQNVAKLIGLLTEKEDNDSIMESSDRQEYQVSLIDKIMHLLKGWLLLYILPES